MIASVATGWTGGAVEQRLAPDKALELKMAQDGVLFINVRFAGEACCSADRRVTIRDTVHRFVLLTTSVCLLGCPYEAPVEPAGEPLPLRSAIVGNWACGTEEEPEWAHLALGWHDASMYHLVFRPYKPPDPGEWVEPAVGFARPRRVGGREIWSLWTDEVDDPATKYSFWRIERAAGESLTFSTLGDGKSLSSSLLYVRVQDLVSQSVRTTRLTLKGSGMIRSSR